MKTMIKIQKGFIKIPILIFIFVGLLLIIGGGYFGFIQYKNYQELKVEKLKKEIQALESERLPQDIINKIMPRVVSLLCINENGMSLGSGTIIAPTYITENGKKEWMVFTNLHVVLGNSKKGLVNCHIRIPQGEDYMPSGVIPVSIISPHNEYYPDIDFAILTNREDTNKSFDDFPLPVCKKEQIEIGNPVMLFGYPGFGGNTLTVTDGIISGIVSTEYGPIYKTSAKIDSGNSGGIAINSKQKCIVGIPTWAVEGDFEGMGFIQSWDMIKRLIDF